MSDLSWFISIYHKQWCRKRFHQTASWNNKAYKYLFHPLMCHNEDMVFCGLYWLCHPVSQWLSLCVFCSGMSWTHRATDSSSLDGEWPFLQPIRCHWLLCCGHSHSERMNHINKSHLCIAQQCSWGRLVAFERTEPGNTASFKQTSWYWYNLFMHYSAHLEIHCSVVD